MIGRQSGRAAGIIAARCSTAAAARFSRSGRAQGASRAGRGDDLPVLRHAGPAQKGHRGAALGFAPLEGRDLALGLKGRAADRRAVVEIEQDEIGIGTHHQGALARPEPEGARRGLAGEFDVVLQRQSPGGDLRQHQAHRGLDAGEARRGFPDRGAVLFLNRMRGMVGRDHVDGAVEQGGPECRSVTGLAHRRLDAERIASGPLRIVHAQEQVMRAGLGGDGDAAPLGRGDHRQGVAAVLVGDMDLAARPFRKQRDALHGLDGGDVGMLGEMGGEVVATGGLHLCAAPVQDRRVLGMDGATQAGLADQGQRIEHGAVVRTGYERVVAAEEELEGAGAGLRHRLEVSEIGFADIAVDAEIDMGLGGRDGDLLPHRGGIGRRRVGVGHVEDRGDAADGRRGGGRRPGLLVREAGLADMGVDVERAGDERAPAGLDHPAGGGHGVAMTDRDDAAIVDRDGAMSAARCG
eukprot:gene12454-16703_t